MQSLLLQCLVLATLWFASPSWARAHPQVQQGYRSWSNSSTPAPAPAPTAASTSEEVTTTVRIRSTLTITSTSYLPPPRTTTSNGTTSDEETTTVRRTSTVTRTTTLPRDGTAPGISRPTFTATANGTTNGTCVPSCSLEAIEAPVWEWVPVTYTTTITAATVLVLFNNRTNTTRTTTVFNSLDPQYTLPETNAAGTRVVTISMEHGTASNFTTLLTYPTEYYKRPTTYRWGGTLPTTAANGSSVCSTERRALVTINSYPNIPQPTAAPTFPEGGDAFGLDFEPSVDLRFVEEDIVTAVFGPEAAFSLCGRNAVAPQFQFARASFLTETSSALDPDDGAPAEPVEPAPVDAPANEPTQAPSSPEPGPGAPAPGSEPDSPQPAPTPGPGSNINPIGAIIDLIRETEPRPANPPAQQVNSPALNNPPPPAANNAAPDNPPRPVDNPAPPNPPAPVNNPAPPSPPAPVNNPAPENPPAPANNAALGSAPAPVDNPAPQNPPAPANNPASENPPAPADNPAPDSPPASVNNPAPGGPPGPDNAPASGNVLASPGGTNPDGTPGAGGNPGSGNAPGPDGSPGSDSPTGTGNAPSSGDAPGSGNAPGPGTAPGTGYVPPSGGAPGPDGTSNSGGTPGAGGNPGSGNAPASGGSNGAGESPGAGNVPNAGGAPSPGNTAGGQPQPGSQGQSPAIIPADIAGASTIPAGVVVTPDAAAGQVPAVNNAPVTLNNPGSSPATITGAGIANPIVITPASGPAATPAATPAPAAPLVIGGTTVTPNAASEYVIAGQTLNAGAPVTLNAGPSETVVALSTNAAGETVAVVNDAQGSSSSVTLAGQAAAGDAGGAFVVDGQTLTPGGSITLNPGPSETVVALTTDAGGAPIVVVNGEASTPVAPVRLNPLVVGGTTYAPNSASAYVVDGQTLTLGGSIVVGSGPSTTNVALTTDAAGAPIFVVNAGRPTITIGGQTYTANTAGVFLVGGQTLTPGGSITVGSGPSSTVVALTTDAAGNTVFVEGGTRSATLGRGSATRTPGQATPSSFQGAASSVVGRFNKGTGLGWLRGLVGMWAAVLSVTLGTVVLL